jgi:hypothetical protein
LYAAWLVKQNGVGQYVASISNGASNGYLIAQQSSTTNLYAYVNVTGTLIGSIALNTDQKVALSYNGISNFTVLNGASPTTISTGFATTPNQLYIGASYVGNIVNGYIKKLAYYPIAVSSTNLQALTGS